MKTLNTHINEMTQALDRMRERKASIYYHDLNKLINVINFFIKEANNQILNALYSREELITLARKGGKRKAFCEKLTVLMQEVHNKEQNETK